MASDRLTGKIAIITGGSSGIGAACARRFVEEGAKVVLGDVDTDKADALSDELGDAALSQKLDVCDSEDWAAIFALAQSLGQVTTLVNSAGISIPGSIEDIDLAAFRQIISVNLEGVFLGCKFGVENIKAAKGGAIINVGSTLGLKPSSMFPAYASSKGGVRMLTRSVALHCAEQGYDIRVNTLIPGAIHTEMVERFVAAGAQVGQSRDDVISGFADAHPMKRLGTPEEAANALVFLASDEASFSTGGDLMVDGGMLA